jgi:starvation-inducible DNA-binding protein
MKLNEFDFRNHSTLAERQLGQGGEAISESLNRALADAFALYIKTKNFHWHVSGPHFRDYHLLFDEQSAQILAMTDVLAERIRKIGGTTLRSIGHIARLKTLADNDEKFVSARNMLGELREDNIKFAQSLRASHELCEEYGDIAGASIIENLVDEAEQRAWFLFESMQ